MSKLVRKAGASACAKFSDGHGDYSGNMKRDTVSSILLLFLAACALWATYCILEPFLWPILTAVVLAIAFHPLFTYLRRFCGSNSRAALATVVLLIVAVVVPLTAIATVLTQEIYGLVETVSKQSQQSGSFALLLESWMDRAVALASPVVQISAEDAKAHLADALHKARLIVLTGAGGLLGDVFSLAIQTLVVMVLVYFLLRDGRAILQRVTRFVLLDHQRTERLLQSVTGTIQASMNGILTIAVSEAILMGIALAMLGVPGAVLWGAVTLFASLVPMVGTSLVWLPAAVYLFVTAGWVKAAAIVVFGIVVMGGIDNFVRPLLMKGKVELPSLVLLFALVGGTKLFGMIGLFAGPVILGVTVALLDMVESDFVKAGLLDEDTGGALIGSS